MTPPIERLLVTYPRTRPPLTTAHETLYITEYKINREGRTLATAAAVWLEQWMHRTVARRGGAGSILEIGAGTLNHIPFERDTTIYDFVEPFEDLWSTSQFLNKARLHFLDIAELASDVRYERIISIAVLEHLVNLPSVVANCALHLTDGGVFQAGIPSEGGLAWSVAWRCFTGVMYKMRTGLDYGTIMRHEHVNTADEIARILRHFFASVRILRFPAPFLQFSLYTYLEAAAPRIEACREYLASIATRPASDTCEEKGADFNGSAG